jgi:hypothetical protein
VCGFPGRAAREGGAIGAAAAKLLASMRTLLLTLSVIALYVLHQDFWFWRDGTLVFGVMPIGLFYHAMYCLAASVLMWALVTFAWPRGLEE